MHPKKERSAVRKDIPEEVTPTPAQISGQLLNFS